jgi:hypothetical protein
MKIAPAPAPQSRISASLVVAFAAVIILSGMLLRTASAQHITTVDPPSGKVDDTVTLTGDGLGKASVVAVLLSDDKNDYKATIVSQADDKIVIKVPKVKAGGYNVSIQDAKTIMILPVRFTVEQ